MAAGAQAAAVAITIDDCQVQQFGELIRDYGQSRFGYVVTPNVDHLIRYCDDSSFRALYAGAEYTLFDSRFLAHVLALTRRLRIGVCPGSDLVQWVFEHLLRPDDAVVLVGGSAQQAADLRQRFGLRGLHHIDPPMGFIRQPEAVEACLLAIEQVSPFRLCLLAVGSPQQEVLACELKRRGRARGLALCIGAAVNFVTRQERRAPRWMQRLGLEWLFRLLANPRRLARRYLLRGPQIFLLLPRIQIRLRRPALPAAR